MISDLLTYHHKKFQDALNTKEFKITLNELSEYDSINDLTSHLILKEVESKLVDFTFDGLLSYFEKTLSISRNREIINWDKIIEIRERRHLIVHNSAKVNKKYIQRTKNPFELKVGDTVSIGKEYFKEAYDELRLAGYILLMTCWGNWDKDKIDEAVTSFMHLTYDSLQATEYVFTERLSNYLEQIEPRNEEQEDIIMRTKINRFIALKKLEKAKELEKELETIKLGTIKPIFKMAYVILTNGEDEKVLDLVKKCKLLEEVDLEDYREWPLFSFVRNKNELDEKILNILKD